jgi:hypothetical protein
MPARFFSLKADWKVSRSARSAHFVSSVNKALALQQKWVEEGKSTRFYYECLADLSPEWKREYP